MPQELGIRSDGTGMHRTTRELIRFRRHLALGITGLGLATSGFLVSNSGNQSVDPSEQLVYNPESVETAKQLWIGVDTSEPLASCFTDVLRDAGVLAEPIKTNADLVAAHESMTDDQQQQLDNCRTEGDQKTQPNSMVWT